jgi:hypothetical protein
VKSAVALASEIDSVLSQPDGGGVEGATRALVLLEQLEATTPGGAPLHRQIDIVRRWLSVIRNEAEHARFGGLPHLTDYLTVQLRLLRAAVDDYLASRP